MHITIYIRNIEQINIVTISRHGWVDHGYRKHTRALYRGDT